MNDDKGIEEVIKELISLSKRTPLRGEDQERAKELMILLKEHGYTNGQISKLLEGKLSERTIKSYTKKVTVKDSSSKDEAISLLSKAVQENLTLEDIEQTVGVIEDLRAKGLGVRDVITFLEEVKSSGMDTKIVLHAFSNLKQSGLSVKQLSETLGYIQNLQKQGFALVELEKLLKACENYGGYNQVLDAITAYRSVEEMKGKYEWLVSEITKFENQKSELGTEIDWLQKKEAEIKAPIDLYQRLLKMGYDMPVLKKLEESTAKWGTLEKVLEATNSYATLQDLKRDIANEDSKFKEKQLAYANLQTVISMCSDLLYRYKYDVPFITNIYRIAKQYGEPSEVLRALEMYGDKATIEDKISLLEKRKNELEPEVKSLEEKVVEIKGQVPALEEQKKDILEQVEFANAIEILIRDPRGIAEYFLKTLAKRFNDALEKRAKGLTFASQADLMMAKQELIKSIIDTVTMDALQKAKLAAEVRKYEAEIKRLSSEVKKRDNAVKEIDENLFSRLRGLYGFQISCPKCSQDSLHRPVAEDWESLLQKGYLTFKCVPCGETSNLTLNDIYLNVLKNGFYSLKRY
ncbi:MAG: hypothetical protein ABSB40_02615 [Nitrososphaeria archaeon]|jgi:hypothetical protein